MTYMCCPFILGSFLMAVFFIKYSIFRFACASPEAISLRGSYFLFPCVWTWSASALGTSPASSSNYVFPLPDVSHTSWTQLHSSFLWTALYVPEPHSSLDVALFGVCPIPVVLACYSSTTQPVTVSFHNASRIFYRVCAHKFFLSVPCCKSNLQIPALIKECIKGNLEYPNTCSISFLWNSTSTSWYTEISSTLCVSYFVEHCPTGHHPGALAACRPYVVYVTAVQCTASESLLPTSIDLSACHRSSLSMPHAPKDISWYVLASATLSISLHRLVFSSSPFRTTSFHPLSPEGAPPVFFRIKSISGEFGSRFVSLASSRSWNLIDAGKFRNICFERKLQNCNSCSFYKSFRWSIQIAGRSNNTQR